jgi:hypothetical protein
MLIQSILFTKEECDKIIELSKNYNLDGDNGRWDDIDNFRYKFYTYSNPLDTKWILDRLHIFFEENMELKIYPWGKNINIHHYTIGDQFGKHIDTGGPIKEWNIGIILNEDYVGGDYNIYDSDDNKITIEKKIGNVSIYQSQTPHEITPVTEGEKWSAAVFITKERVFNSDFIAPNQII